MSPRSASSSSGISQFTFVTDKSQSEARSHAMREHWRQRHKRNQEAKASHRRTPRTLRPRSMVNEEVCRLQDSDTTSGSVSRQQDNSDDYRKTDSNIASQLLHGLGRALAASRPDPFQTCPVRLTSQHQKLLHHWMNTHATMMFEDLGAISFNPMKDVWFPLDLSNASSFNCIMAHSAAHLAHLYAGTCPQRGTDSSDALKYKAEAMRILRDWLTDPAKYLSDNAFAAVARLLTFERYWGTEDEWNIHRDGLQNMIEAKGGVENLRDNWRLELVVYLVSLMSKPSWFESTNHLEEISRPSSQLLLVNHTRPSLDVQKVRCLWLISFIQDMRTFMGHSYAGGLSLYPSIYATVGLLHYNYQLSVAATSPNLGVSALENDMLACLFSIGIMLQESVSAFYDATLTTSVASNRLARLDAALSESQDSWSTSVHILCSILYQCLRTLYDAGYFKVNYVVEMVNVLGALSMEARQGVEKCLLNLFSRLGNKGTMLLIDDGWTPDSLLSSMHGH